MKIILSIAKTNILNKNKHTKYNFLEHILMGREKPIVGFYQGSHGGLLEAEKDNQGH